MTRRQPHIDVAVINHRIGQERVDDAFQIAHTAVGCAGNIADDILGNLQSVATTLRVEDINTECDVGLLQLCYQSAGESG